MIDIILLLCPNEDASVFLDKFPRAKVVRALNKDLGPSTITSILKRTLTKYFYVVTNPRITLVDFDFTYEPDKWDDQHRHVWNNDSTVSLINRASAKTTDVCDMSLKVHTETIYTTSPHDIVFISYDECSAMDNYKLLKHAYGKRVKHVAGIKGIGNAHRTAAEIATTPMVYIVDADALITDEFDFSYHPTMHDEHFIHIWKSRNPVNGLEYGYGGVKLFPTYLLRNITKWNIDFTTSIGKGVKVMDEVSNITSFNTSEYSSWRSAFRECVKLSSGSIKNQIDVNTLKHLEIWCTVGMDSPYGKAAIAGANDGSAYGNAHRDAASMLDKINDFKWLQDYYNGVSCPNK